MNEEKQPNGTVPAPVRVQPDGWAVGDELHLTIKSVSNTRLLDVPAKILSIHGHIAKVEYKQPWAPWWNCMREGHADLRSARKIKRRLRPNARGDRQPDNQKPT